MLTSVSDVGAAGVERVVVPEGDDLAARVHDDTGLDLCGARETCTGD